MPMGVGYGRRRGRVGGRGRRARFKKPRRMFRKKFKAIRPIRRGKRWPN